MAAVTIRSDFGAQENKLYHCFHFFPFYLPWSDGPDTKILVFWMLSFKSVFSLSSFTFIKRLFSSSLLSAIRVVSFAFLRLLIFPLAILIPVYDSPNLAFCMMYSAYKLNKQGDNIPKEIKPVQPKGNQPWIFIERMDTDTEASILWLPDMKSGLTGKDPDAWGSWRKDWGQEEKGATEDEMVGWHHWLNGPEFEYTPGGSEGQGRLVCCSSWGCKESDIT